MPNSPEEMGHTGAAYALGLAAFNRALDALGESDNETRIATEQRLRDCIPWLDYAARKDQLDAWYILGLMHGYGLGVKKSRRIAADYFRIWRNCGPSAEEKYNLGLLYSSGNGFLLDNSEANRLFIRAASEGYAKAQYKLAQRSWEGQAGFWGPDAVTYWLRRAADQGHADALRQLGPGYRLVRFCAVVAARCNVLLRSWLRRRW